MNIKQVEQTTGLTARQIREYETIGLIPAMTRTPHIVTLNEKIEQLQAMKSTLQVWHDSCKGDGTAECGILDKLAIKE